MNPSTVIKKEQGISNDSTKNSTASKVKFKPTLPKKKVESETPISAKAPQSDFNKTNDFKCSNNQPPYTRRGGDRGRGAHSGQSGGRGRGDRGGGGRFVMPTGQAFFQGGSTSTSSTGVTLSIGGGGGGGSHGTAGRDREKTNSGIDPVKMDMVAEKGEMGAPSLHKEELAPPIPLSGAQDTHMTEEIWPPVDYFPLAPVHLPFAPLSASSHKKRSSEPLFAAANDKTARRIEEDTTVLLLQLPSIFRLPESKKTSTGIKDESSNEKTGETVPNKSLSNTGTGTGKIGKLQILRSGKVFLLTNDNKKYEVTAGLEANFLQQVAALEISGTPPPPKAVPPPSKKGHPTHASSAPEDTLLDTHGSLYMLGPITRKLVVTPDFDIGIDDDKYSSIRSSAVSANLNTTSNDIHSTPMIRPSEYGEVAVKKEKEKTGQSARDIDQNDVMVTEDDFNFGGF